MSRLEHVKARTRRGRARRDVGALDDGFTLLELLIATSIGLVILSIVMVSLPVFVETGQNGVALGQADNRADIALSKIEQQVIAGKVIFDPATEGTKAGPAIPPGYSLRVLSSATTPTACYQWRVTTHVLQVRHWQNGTSSVATAWATVVTGIENTGTTDPPFTLDTTKAYGNRLLNVDLVLSLNQAKSTTTRVRTSVAANDAEFFTKAQTQFCTPVPAP